MRVAVIGAGFSGMLAAYLLEKEGNEVTVYEKKDTIGGHCHTLITKDFYTELGSVFTMGTQIKELLLELKVDYTERFSYRSFVDANYNIVEHMLREDVVILMEELTELRLLLDSYSSSLKGINYGYIHEDLMAPLSEFLKIHKLKMVCQVIAPHLSSYGFGNICDIQAYYAFKIFDIDTIYAFIRGDKLLFIDKGNSELIKKLSENISDIRYGLEVKNIEVINHTVKVETLYSSETFDKVLITSKLSNDVIKDPISNQLMAQIDTHPYITCAYEVSNRKLATTYFKHNLGKKNKIQFFYTFKHNHQTTLVAYAYGIVQKDLVNDITEDLIKSGVELKHLITAKQWHIFPHLNEHHLTQNFYADLIEGQKTSPISFIGSLISKPSLANLYISVKSSIKKMIED